MIRIKKLLVNEFDVKLSIYPNGFRVFDDSSVVDLQGHSIKGILDETGGGRVSPLAYDIDADVFQKIQLRDNTDYEFSIEMPLTQRQYLEGYETNSLFPFANNSLKNIVKFNGPDSCTELPGGRYRLTGRFNFENRAGTSYLDIEIEAGYKINIPVEVLTQKLDYYDEFQQLLHQISEYSADLLVRFDTATETNFGVSSDLEKSPMAELMAFRRLFRNGRISSYVREILNNPSSKITTKSHKEDAAFTTNPDWSTLAQSAIDYDFMSGGVLQDSFSGYTPLNLPDKKVLRTFDTKDNRFIKSTLQLLRDRLEYLKRRMPKKYSASKDTMQLWGEELDSLLFHPLWAHVGTSDGFPNSMVMANRKGYREYVIFYLAFGLSIQLESESTLLSVGGEIKQVFHLYEIWCYLMIHKVLCEMTNSQGKPHLSFAKRDNDFMKDLINKNDRPIEFDLSYGDTKVTLALFYNKDFLKVTENSTQWTGSYSGVFNPDISISIAANDEVHWIHFDAKYRLDFSKWKEELEGDTIATSFKRDDIHKMHTYRDALLGTRGSYVLYPGSENLNELYVRNPEKTYRDTNIVPSVGAFPLKPTSHPVQEQQQACIKDHIDSCISYLVDADFTYHEEHGLK
jgi:predicted component of viral defense system (DUF524 family)